VDQKFVCKEWLMCFFFCLSLACGVMAGRNNGSTPRYVTTDGWDPSLKFSRIERRTVHGS